MNRPDPRRWYIAQGLPVPLWLDSDKPLDPAAARAKMIERNQHACGQDSAHAPASGLHLDAHAEPDPAASHRAMVARNANAWRSSVASTGTAPALRTDAAQPGYDPYDVAAARAKMTQRHENAWRGQLEHRLDTAAPARPSNAPPSVAERELGPKTMDAILDKVIATLSPEARQHLRLDASSTSAPRSKYGELSFRYGESIPIGLGGDDE